MYRSINVLPPLGGAARVCFHDKNGMVRKDSFIISVVTTLALMLGSM